MDIRSVYIYDFTEADGVGTHMKKRMTEEENDVCEELCEELNGEMSNLDRREVAKGSSMFYCLKQDGKMFLCIAGDNAKKRAVFGLLEACAEDSDFDVHDMSQSSIMIKRHMEHYNNPDNDEIIKCVTKMDEVKTVMVDNVDRVLRNMEQVGDLLEQAKELEDTGRKFRRRARQTETIQIKKNVLIGSIIICISLCLCLIVLGVIIAGFTIIGLLVGILVEVLEKDDDDENTANLITFLFSFVGL